MNISTQLNLSKLSKCELLKQCETLGILKCKSKTKPNLIKLINNMIHTPVIPEIPVIPIIPTEIPEIPEIPIIPVRPIIPTEIPTEIPSHNINDILINLFNLPEITYNKSIINVKSIYAFNISSKQLNDKNNKTRENIIGAILNNKIPNEYYTINKWLSMKKSISIYIDKLKTNNINKIINIVCNHKGGRNNNYDFIIILYYDNKISEIFNIELKFNCSTITETPQFVSPMNPSKYLDNSYEDYYYDKYLIQLSEHAKLPMPLKTEYLKQIHSNKPKCIIEFQNLYYQGCASSSKFTKNTNAISFYNLAKQLSNNSIENFIINNNLNYELLTNYLKKTQKDKIYMLYNNNSFTLYKNNIDDYTIVKVNKNASKFRYECISKTGSTLYILLRWKNGNGIAYPAFQIS